MSIQYGNFTEYYASGVTTTLAIPAGVVDGDFLLAFVYVQRTEDNHASNNGFTLIANLNNPNSAMRATMWYKRAAGEGATVSWTHSSGTMGSWLIHLPGVIKVGNPLDSAIGSVATVGTTSVAVPSVNTATPNSAVIFGAVRIAAAVYSAETLTRRIVKDGTSGGSALFAATQPAPGATGINSVTTAASNNYHIGHQFGLLAEPSGFSWGEVT